MKQAPTTIDQYLAALDPDKRAALQKMRATIKAAAPQAEECISYGVPTFKLHGKALIHFGAAANHCALYGALEPEFKDALSGYDTSKGTIRFQPERPLPAALIRKMVKARAARMAQARPARARK